MPELRIGAVFPQNEIGNDPAAIRDYAQAVEGMGFRHLLAYDHVVGAGTANRPDWRGPYTDKTPFHEVFVLFAYLAALTQHLELVTGVLILPQRQTVLVAKQAAQLDLLSGGRLRLGVGIGWNEVEYQALNEDFHTRGARSEEQIAVLRALWTAPVVTFNGQWHHIPEAGINPLPVQRPIPIWIGGDAEPVLNRIARIGDGWFPQSAPDEATRAQIERLHGYLREAGRAPESLGIEAHLNLRRVPEGERRRFVEGWRRLGATHLTINTMGLSFTSPQMHIDALRRAKAEVSAT